MFKTTLISVALVLASFTASAQSTNRLEDSIKRDLDQAIQNLNNVREQIKEEKIPLARRLNELESELRVKRREVERIQRLRDNATVDLNRLEDNVAGRIDQIDYMSNLIAEYGRSFEVRIDLSETQKYRAALDAFHEVNNDAELSRAEKLEDQFAIVSTSIDRVQNLIGGYRFEGEAVNLGGGYERGKFALIGPTVLFANPSSRVAGLSISSGSLEPSIFSLGSAIDSAILNLVEQGEGWAPMDATLGNALAIKSQEQSLIEHIQAGGIWIYPILAFALASMLTALFKAIEIYSVKMPEHGVLHHILVPLNEGNVEEAKARAMEVQGPAGKMLLDGVVHSDETKELVEEVMYESMLDLQPKMERLLPFIAVTAATAPLMGLLGTVTGMINTFKLITIFGTGDAKSLSGGISEALVTTEFGLIVAIPSLILHALLSRRAQGVLASMERLAVAFVNGLNRKN